MTEVENGRAASRDFLLSKANCHRVCPTRGGSCFPSSGPVCRAPGENGGQMAGKLEADEGQMTLWHASPAPAQRSCLSTDLQIVFSVNKHFVACRLNAGIEGVRGGKRGSAIEHGRSLLDRCYTLRKMHSLGGNLFDSASVCRSLRTEYNNFGPCVMLSHERGCLNRESLGLSLFLFVCCCCCSG